jgi:predicted nuclease with RNAse H fold
MGDFTITERTEPFTLEEVFDFIDDTNISKMDAYELKSRIVDAVQGIRAKAIDECIRMIEETTWRDTEMLVESIRQLKGGAE